MTIVFAIGVCWFIISVAILLVIWTSAVRDVSFALDIPAEQLRRLTRELRFFPLIGIVRWAVTRGKPWQRRATVQFFVGAPLYIAVVVLAAVVGPLTTQSL